MIDEAIVELRKLIEKETGCVVNTAASWLGFEAGVLGIDASDYGGDYMFEALLHEFLHWLVATPKQHEQNNLGLTLGGDPPLYWMQECWILTAERDLFKLIGVDFYAQVSSNADPHQERNYFHYYASEASARRSWRASYHRRISKRLLDRLVSIMKRAYT